ncbi:hypothetical protein [Sutcliffiella horikoshii]|uniref:hypothetical protein n=1 Tax=Sutcliffiella horikoshii TaxID=79883 RepID=UPI001CFECD97|nr:hypothetical protein [Sutcliffiella horikoshii]
MPVPLDLPRLIIVCSLVLILLASCSSAEISEEHLRYLNDNGWTVSRVLEKEPFSLPDNEESLNELRDKGLNPEELGKQETLYIQTVVLKERCEGKLTALIYSNQDNNIVGAQIVIEDVSPGVLKLVDSTTFMNICKEVKES